MRKAIGFLVAFVVSGTMLSLAGGAVAHDSFSAGHGPRLSLLAPCLNGITDVTFAAGTSFWIGHGWVFGAWSQATPQERQEFMAPSTRFELWMDGVAMPSSMWAPTNPDTDTKSKLFITDFHGGLTGAHLYVGRWMFSQSLANECTLTVRFV